MAVPLAACAVALGLRILYKATRRSTIEHSETADEGEEGTDHIALDMRELSAQHWNKLHYRIKNESHRA